MASTDISLFAYEATELKKEKAPNALRTISEAAEILDVPQHVLRFWETKFNQIKPLKRNGGRRFYRPQDLDVLQQIKHLLYNQGYTIKGAKKAIDDFIHARGASPEVTSEAWMAVVPPASVNDNFMPAVAAVEQSPAPMQEIMTNIADALSEVDQKVTATVEAESASIISYDELRALRDQLVSLRDGLRLHLPAMSATYQ